MPSIFMFTIGWELKRIRVLCFGVAVNTQLPDHVEYNHFALFGSLLDTHDVPIVLGNFMYFLLG